MTVSQRLVTLIERNADELTRKWLEIIRTHPETPTYRSYDEKRLYGRAFRVYSQLGKWISHHTSKQEIAEIYRALGGQRRGEGFGLAEIVLALILTRRVLWQKVQSDGLLDTALDLNMAMDLHNHVALFFDRAIVHSIRGYEEAPPG